VKDGLEKMRNRKTGWEVTPSKKWWYLDWVLVETMDERMFKR
jgi:hypothetical protein